MLGAERDEGGQQVGTDGEQGDGRDDEQQDTGQQEGEFLEWVFVTGVDAFRGLGLLVFQRYSPLAGVAAGMMAVP